MLSFEAAGGVSLIDLYSSSVWHIMIRNISLIYSVVLKMTYGKNIF